MTVWDPFHKVCKAYNSFQYILLLHEMQWEDQLLISHISWQLHYRDNYKHVKWQDHYNGRYKKANFHKISSLSAQTLGEIASDCCGPFY